MSAVLRPPVQAPPWQFGGAVLIQGAPVRDLVYPLSRGIAMARRGGQHRHVSGLKRLAGLRCRRFIFRRRPEDTATSPRGSIWENRMQAKVIGSALPMRLRPES
jgi:hypothetical protein